jgi:hypothetical protein
VRFLKVLLVALGLAGPASAGTLTPSEAARLFERVRAEMPCMVSAPEVARRSGLTETSASERSSVLLSREYADSERSSFLITSLETGNDRTQTAASVSIYNSGEDFPADLTNAFADIWNLPVPTPLRDNPSLAQFEWRVSFPNGSMQIIISYSPDTDLTQIYGRTLGLKRDVIDGCPR